MEELLLSMRYTKMTPSLRYIVPFSYGNLTYDEARRNVLESNKWRVATRSDIVPSHEEDLYDHIYTSILETGRSNNNIGVSFVPTCCSKRHMVYRFVRETENRSVLDFHFYLKDAGLYLFKTGICFYVYEAIFSDDFTNNVDLSLDELVVFQNRIKELNVLRGFQSKGLNYYGIYPYDAGRNNNTEKIEFYTQAQVIANDLKSIFGEVYYFPPRVNEIIKMNKKAEIQKKWDNKRKEFGIKGITSDQKKYIKYKKGIDAEQEQWSSITVSEIAELSDEDIPGQDERIVPDKALIFCYVVFNATSVFETNEEKNAAINQFCKYVYYLTRGYKHSYKVAPDAANERSKMFERHENDYWDASLEGAGDFVLLYQEQMEIDKEKGQSYSHFFDNVRPKEMRGDYFILYILLLYQHYSIVLYSKKISEVVPAQSSDLEHIADDNDILFKNLQRLKNDLDLFMANSMFEAVGQITDVCNLYAFIEEKLQIKKNLSTLRQGLDSINHICEQLIKNNEKEREEKVNQLVQVFGFLAIISIVMDAMSLLLWFKKDLLGNLFDILHIQSTSPVFEICFIVISIVIFIALLFVGIKALVLFRKYNTKSRER